MRTDLEQGTFRELIDDDYAKRVEFARVPKSGIRVIHDAADPDCRGKETARHILHLRNLLFKFVRSHGLGHEFQSIDFSHWVNETRPGLRLEIDMRAIGGMIRDLHNAGLIERLGYKSNGGDAKRNYNATPRAVWRIVHIDYSLLGWGDDERASGYEEPFL